MDGFVDDELLLNEVDEEAAAEFEESEEEKKEEEAGAIEVVLKTKKPRVAKFGKEETAFARSLFRASMVCSVAHVLFGERLAATIVVGNDDAFPGFPKLKRHLVDRFKALMRDAQTELEVFVKLLAVVRSWNLESRLVFAQSFASWKPGVAVDEDARPVYWLEIWKDDKFVSFFPNKAAAEERIEDDLSYVFACRHGQVREIAVRFSNEEWSKVCSRRFDEPFLAETLDRVNAMSNVDEFQRRSDEWEEQEKRKASEAEELPTSLSSFKKSPTYILESHISGYFGLIPGAERAGKFGKDAVYFRRDVRQLHTREQWLERHAKVPISGQDPCKKIPSRKKKEKETELFGPWQVEDYDPGEADEDGMVPKNEHNNVYLYKPTMMPRRCVLIESDGKAASLLGIDFAKALVGWEYKRHGCHPVFAKGIIVAAEFADAVMMAHEQRNTQEQEKMAKRDRDKAIKNWKRLIHRAVVFKRLGSVFKK